MILSSLAVMYINTEESKEMGEDALGMYQVFTISDDASSATSLGLSLVNALIIVTVIGAMTFVIVLLYKYRCMKCLLGYMCFATTVLLMFLGGNMFTVAINKYHISIDKISYWFTMYNFAIVGTLAIFYQKGVPLLVNQGYLIANSTIVAWQLSYFNDWMAWSLLIMLALYDLFAVLTPCGPLKALVNLMSKNDAPAMPGLLYEAELPQNATRPGVKKKQSENNNPVSETGRNNSEGNGDVQTNTSDHVPGVDSNSIELIDPDAECSRTDKKNVELTAQEGSSVEDASSTALATSTRDMSATVKKANESKTGAIAKKRSKTGDKSRRYTTTNHTPLSSEYSNRAHGDAEVDVASPQITTASIIVQLAIAKVYKLAISLPSTEVANTTIDISHPKAYLEQELSIDELKTKVYVTFPSGGGRIEAILDDKNEPRYFVYDRHGELKRTLLVNEAGKVMEQKKRENDENGSNNIKLGLGDFIFYSVLVSKAAENGFAAFVSCFLAILTGLGGTLVLLAVYHHALPALPISIFLAVVFFVLTIYCMEPWIHQMWQAPFYV